MRQLGCTLLCLFVISSVTAGIWKEDFDDGMPKGWKTIVGKWKVDKKALTQLPTNRTAKLCLAMWLGQIIVLRLM